MQPTVPTPPVAYTSESAAHKLFGRFRNNRKLTKLMAITGILVFAGVGSYLTFGSRAETSLLYYIAPTGSDANPCSQAAPCKTFNRAYQVAQLGSTVEVAAGTYANTFLGPAGQVIPGERITYDATKSVGLTGDQPDVVFRPANGATVIINGNIRVLSSHVTVQDMEVIDAEAFNYEPTGIFKNTVVEDITFENLRGRNFQISSTHKVTIRGGEYGPASACGSFQPTLTQYGGQNNALRKQQNAPDPTNIIIDGVTIHNVMSYSTYDCHTEGLAIFAGSNVTVRNSKFYGNDVYHILAQANSGASPLGNITIQNNWFSQPTSQAGQGTGQQAVDIQTASNVTIRHNSFNGGLIFDVLPPFSNINIIGNIGFAPTYYHYDAVNPLRGSMCDMSGVVVQYNFLKDASGLTCNAATNNKLGTAAFPYMNSANDSSMDYHLLAGSSAIDFVPTGACGLAADIDGTVRPQGAACDAGADEYSGVATPPPPAPTPAPTPTPTPPPSDTTLPIVTITAPLNGAIITSNSATISAKATDNVAVTSLQIYIDNVLYASANSNTLTTSWNTKAKKWQGTRTITVKAKDAAGNTGTKSITVTVR